MLSKIMRGHIPVDITRMRTADFIESQKAAEDKKAALIEKGRGWKRVERCPLCGSAEFVEEFVKSGSPIVMCKECELRYHRLIPADPNDVYNEPSYVLYTMSDSGEHFRYRKERFGRERVELLESVCGPLGKLRLLDVGCGNGFFLAAAMEKFGYCAGSEFSALNRDKARENTGLAIYKEALEDFPERGFDVITAFDVIEHIETPGKFVEAARNLLNPGGFIMLYTPNFDSLSVKIMKDRSSIVDPTEHVILFTQDSLRKLGALCGLETVYMATRGLDMNSVISYQSFIGETESGFLKKWINELQAIIDVSGAADYLRVIYRLPE